MKSECESRKKEWENGKFSIVDSGNWLFSIYQKFNPQISQITQIILILSIFHDTEFCGFICVVWMGQY